MLKSNIAAENAIQQILILFLSYDLCVCSHISKLVPEKHADIPNENQTSNIADATVFRVERMSKYLALASANYRLREAFLRA